MSTQIPSIGRRRIAALIILCASSHRVNCLSICRRSAFAGISAAVTTTILTKNCNYLPASAATNPAGLDPDEIVRQLKPATEDQPQIALPVAKDMQKDAANRSTIQGLLYLKNERFERPVAGSLIIVTVTDAADSKNVVLAGAKFPANRLPVRFALDERNIFNKEKTREWKELLQGKNLLVKAITCLPEDVVDRTDCRAPEGEHGDDAVISMRAVGVSKLLRLDQPGGEQLTMRAAVSLGLEAAR